jgi:hypothetical protein
LINEYELPHFEEGGCAAAADKIKKDIKQTSRLFIMLSV